MEKYDIIDISYPDFKVYEENLEKLKNTDFSNFSVSHIYHRFHDLALTIPGLGGKFVHKKFNGEKLYRVRMDRSIALTENISNIQAFTFPPKEFCKYNGRANLKHKPVFYCTDNIFPSIKECKPKVGESGFISLWQVEADRNLSYATCLPEKLPAKNRWGEYGTFHHNFLVKNHSKVDEKTLKYRVALRKFITKIFMREEEPYSISSMLAHEYLYVNRTDILLYPSAQTLQSYTNFAIHPRVAERYLKCLKILRFKITKDLGEQFQLIFSLIGTPYTGTKINWQKATDEDISQFGFDKL